jgi:hypothetical protein
MMSFFRSLFGRKPGPQPADPGTIKDTVDTLSSFCGDVMRHVGEAAFSGDGMERQTLSAYAFGGVHVLAQQRGLSPPEAHAVCLALLYKYFGFPLEDSAVKAQVLMEAAGERASSGSVINRIIHRGIDGFLHWQEQGESFDASDFKDVMATLKGRPES